MESISNRTGGGSGGGVCVDIDQKTTLVMSIHYKPEESQTCRETLGSAGHSCNR